MLLAALLAFCAAIIGFGIWSGYRKGAVAQLFALGILVVCYLAAGLIGFSGVTVKGLKFVPQLLQPFVLGAVVSLVLYVLLSLLARFKLKALDEFAYREAKAQGIENPQVVPLSKSPVNKRWGMVVGGLKGVVAAGALFVAVYFLAITSLAIQQAAQATSELRAALPPPGGSVPAAPARVPPAAPPNPLAQLGQELRRTPLGRAADAVAPVKEKQIQALGKLGRLSQNPRALERFRHHPDVRRLLQNPRLVALSRDREIARAVKEKRWNDVLNNPAVVSLARDGELQRLVGTVDLDRIVNESLSQPAPQAPAAP